jgi:SAM-dependent methyltransferase
MAESKLRVWLAQQPATKLFFKAIIDLAKMDIFQFKISVLGYYHTLKCHLDRAFKNNKKVECNFCGWKGNIFFPHVTTAGVMHNEKCPLCHSIPRYRSLMKFLKENFNIFDDQLKILEVGPNRSLQEILRNKSNIDYISIDLKSPHAMVHMDVTDLKFEDEQFDLLFCIGVMQYVDDDKKGFEEMYRVLKPNGNLIFASGINEKSETTINYAKRIAEHNFTVREYGWDLKNLIEEVGFKLQLFNPFNDADENEREQFGLGKHTIFLLTK